MPPRAVGAAESAHQGAYRTRPAKRPYFLPLIICALFACAAILALTACSDLGKFNERSVVRQAEQYYADKYGSNATVISTWEDRSYALFGYNSLGRVFCTMSDGNAVLVDFEKGAVIGDNKQEGEIVAAYEQKFRAFVENGKRRLEAAGYEVASAYINGMPYNSDGFFDERISFYEWSKAEGSYEKTGSFFFTRYTGDEQFFRDEAPHVDLDVPSVEFEISGKDASYEDAFPMDVPETPAWVAPVDMMYQSLLTLTGTSAPAEVTVYQSGYRQHAIEDDGNCGLLGKKSPFGDAAKDGGWLIVDWVYLGRGVYITSDESGVRLQDGNVTLKKTLDAISYEKLKATGSLPQSDARSLDPSVFETYQIKAADSLFASLPQDVQDKGWFNVKLAYDNTAPDTGLERLGVTPTELEPCLYRIEQNPAAQDVEDEPPFEVTGMRTTTLCNGMQYSTPALYDDKATLLVRM